MQINNSSSIQTMPVQQTPVTQVNNAPSKVAQEPGVQVSISAQAQQLSQADSVSPQSIQRPPVNLPTQPQNPLTGEKLEQAVQIKKAQTHYKIASDMVNVATNSGSNNMSAATAYYLSENEDAREVVLQTKSQQQTMQNMQAYQEQTNALNEQYA